MNKNSYGFQKMRKIPVLGAIVDYIYPLEPVICVGEIAVPTPVPNVQQQETPPVQKAPEI